MIIEHAPRARCYRCGSPDILTFCHHCGRSMCRQHSSKAEAFKKPLSREFADLGLANTQAMGYHCAEHDHVVKGGLRGLIWAGIAVAVAGLIWAGVAFAVAGFKHGLASVVAGLALMLAGAGLAIAAYLEHRRRKAAEASSRPDLPVAPILESVTVQEALHGRVTLDEDGHYTSSPERSSGSVEVVMALTPSDRDRLQTYRTKYSLAPDDPVGFSAGFAAFKGPAGLTFQPGTEHADMLLPGGTSLAFRGNVTSHPLFSADWGRAARQWRIRLPYGLMGSHIPESIPIWIVPSLVPSSDQRALVVELRWLPIEQDGFAGESRLAFKQFDSIELSVPTSWGYVQSVAPAAVVSDPEFSRFRTIEWNWFGLPPDEAEDPADEPAGEEAAAGPAQAGDTPEASQSPQANDTPLPGNPPQPSQAPATRQPDQGGQPVTEDPADDDDAEEDDTADAAGLAMGDALDGHGPGYQILTIRFEDKIQPSDRISGRLRASFGSTLSGIEGIRMHHSAGGWRRSPTPVVELQITIDFELSLSSVRYQDVRVVPDRDQLKVNAYPGVIPDFETVMELTNKLSAQDCYVKRVVENPPRGSWRTNLVNRYWDIAGRRYHGIFPIDFRITLTGEEEYVDDLRPKAGSANAQLAIHGSYVNETMTGEVTVEDELMTPHWNIAEGAETEEDDETAGFEVTRQGQLTMKGQIEKEWWQLLSIIDDSLGRPRDPGPGR